MHGASGADGHGWHPAEAARLQAFAQVAVDAPLAGPADDFIGARAPRARL
jgi:hypothetical protein